MGTSGFTGFVVDGTEKIAYQQFDSYPSGVGAEVLAFLKTYPELLAKARDLKVVSDNDTPSEADIEALRPWTDLGVSNQSTDDWYCLTRKTHGDPAAILQCGYLLDAHDFPQDSLFCKWGYLVNLDTMTFEVYKGFQKQPHSKGRFAQRKSQTDGYYPVAPIVSYPLASLPDEEQFLADTEDSDDS